MNRNEEYRQLLEELKQPAPDLTQALTQGRKRSNRRRFFYRPLATAAACFGVFVLLVNFCAPVAYACSKLPILKDLAAAVTFSPSLTDAVEHEYVQPMNLSQSKNGITAQVNYLIVDQKQVNVFFRLDSDKHQGLYATPKVLSTEGEFLPCSYSFGDIGVPKEGLRHLTIDFMDETVPDSMNIRLKVYEDTQLSSPVDQADQADQAELPALAEFEFRLDFDPTFTAAGKVLAVNQTIELEGQKITVTQLMVYPTHLRVEIAEAEENTAWLKQLNFAIETEQGARFEPIANGISATGSEHSKSMVSYRSDSPYFYNAKELKLIITGAVWLDKDKEQVKLNLSTQRIDALPEGVALESVSKKGDGWEVSFRGGSRAPNSIHQLFDSEYYDPQGNRLSFDRWEERFGDFDQQEQMKDFIVTLPLEHYPYDEVWLCPAYSHQWTAPQSIVLTVKG